LQDHVHPSAQLPQNPADPDTPTATRLAGLFLLLRVLERLGIKAFFDRHPDLIELEFPQRLLGHSAGHLGTQIHDPVSQLLKLTATNGLNWPYKFVMPLAWSNGLTRAGRWQVSRMQGRRGARLLCDASGHLVLGYWQTKAPAEISAFVKSLSLRRTLQTACKNSETIFLDAWLTAVRRWCRRFANIGLRSLVCRPGRMFVTRMHLDVFFDHRQANLRVRKAGLDVDPGWLPWLGRVVKFHYLYGEQSHGG